MEKITDGVLTLVSASLIVFGGHYTLKQVYTWSQHAALEKAAQGLGRLEPGTRHMTGMKRDVK